MIDTTNTQDLRNVYLYIFDSFSVHGVSEVADRFGFNTRYSRELLAALVHSKLVVTDLDEDGGDFWQAWDTIDDSTREEAEARFDEWAAPKTRVVAAATGARQTTEVNGVQFKACGCGCGQPISGKRSTYRPGHDARHAGMVGREAYDAFSHGQGAIDSKEFYLSLPSEALKAKALAVAQRMLLKEQTKAAKKGKIERRTGEVKVGRWTYPARTHVDGSAQRNTKRDGSGEWVPVEADSVQWA